MHKSDIVTTNADNAELKALRRRVFIEEQHVPEELEWDEHDSTATHFLLYLDGRAIACARLKTDGQIGRMAVLPEYRRQGHGSRLLAFVLQAARQQSLPAVYLHAQISAIPFYEKHGFSAHGDSFMDAGIEHREMFLNIC
ncbi:MAG TPA: GNAT family N-acetyltransferase [Gammaproteobacteria bacterium]|nr:GNAT family N-acetyltransferase [Gammaproteobacteria bacterium]